MTFGRSVEPIVALEHAITRMAVTNERDVDKERTMGRKFTVPYGLYRSHGFVSSFLAKQTGFSSEDLELFWQALCQMFEHDRSAAIVHVVVCRRRHRLGSMRGGPDHLAMVARRHRAGSTPRSSSEMPSSMGLSMPLYCCSVMGRR